MPPAANARSESSGRDPQLKRLLIRPGAIGDTIVSLPALEFGSADYTEVWCSEPVVPLIRFADRVRSIGATGLDLLELGLDDRARRDMAVFDSIWSWYGAGREEFRSAVADLPVQFFEALPAAPGVHATDFYVRQVGGPDGLVPGVDVGLIARRSTIVIHPFSGSAKKNWPLASFRQLAASLPLPVDWTCGPDDEELEGAFRFKSLHDLAQWIAGAALYIGNDSGITHLAAAVGTPVLAVFRSSDASVWGPRGRARVRVVKGDAAFGCVRAAALKLLGC